MGQIPPGIPLTASMKNQNIHSESWKGLSEALETCQTIEWRGQLESCNLEREWLYGDIQIDS